MLADLNHKQLTGNFKGAENRGPMGALPYRWKGTFGTPRAQDPWRLGAGQPRGKVSLQTVAYGARGSSECLWARKGCGGRADEPTSIPTLFWSRTAFIYVVVLLKFHLKNVPSC